MRTIVAQATPPGISGLAVIRLSGDDAVCIAEKCFRGVRTIAGAPSHTILYGRIYASERVVDTVTVSIFLKPNSYTGEDVIEIGCHGGTVVINEILELLLAAGAVAAGPGEFTRRAFLNGKLDLSQVEAVADIIHAVSVPGVRTAVRQLQGEFTGRLRTLRTRLLDISGLLELELDFSEEGLTFVSRMDILRLLNEAIVFCRDLYGAYRAGDILRSGFRVAIVGFPNSGKSTLFNAILGRERAIVSELPGTTRDYLEEAILLGGMKFLFTDTAGLRDASDIIELEGIRLVHEILAMADLVLVLNDVSKGENFSDKLFEELHVKYPDYAFLLLQNKVDLIAQNSLGKGMPISAQRGDGVGELLNAIYAIAAKSVERVGDILINRRHYDLLVSAENALHDARTGLEGGLENELIAIDMRRATSVLGELTGESWNEEVLDRIFSSFCIGK